LRQLNIGQALQILCEIHVVIQVLTV